MKVKELMAELAKHDPEMEVYVPYADEGWVATPDLNIEIIDNYKEYNDSQPGPRITGYGTLDGYEGKPHKVLVIAEIS